MLPQLKSCCCGCSLRTGTLIIAWMSVVGAVLGIIVCIAAVVVLETDVKQAAEQGGVAVSLPDAGATQEDQKTIFIVIRAVLIVAIIVCLVELIVTSLLLHGVYKARPHLFKPWIVCAIIALVLQCISVLGNIVVHFIAGYIGFAVLEMFLGPCAVLVGLYYVCIVNSHRIELLTQNASPKIEGIDRGSATFPPNP